jgi:hypothetical protein
MTTRKKAQKSYRKAADASKKFVEKSRSRGGASGKLIDGGLKGGKSLAKAVGVASTKVIAKTTQIIGLEEYRTELEKALDEAVRVIAVQEARIARLEDELSKRD